MVQHKFQRRHYIAIANGIAESLYEARQKYYNSELQTVVAAIQLATDALAVQFYHDNPKFNRSKFMIACGLQEGAKK